MRRMPLGVFAVALGLVLQPGARAQSGSPVLAPPTIDQLISFKRAASPVISPNGQWVAYMVREANWDENDYHTEIWLADVKSGELRQLTSHAKKSSSSPAWSADSSRLAFATDRDDKRQIYVIDPRGGEARKITSVEDGVGAFQWSPDGRSFALTSADPKTDADKEREKKFGEFDVIGEGYRMSHLWLFDLSGQTARRITSGAFTVGQFSWSPDGSRIAFDHRVNTALTSGSTADISIVNVADGTVRPLVTQPGSDSGPVWSPDGSTIAFGSAMAKEYSFLNGAIAVVPAAGGRIENLTTAFDENPSIVDWTRGGLFFSASQRTWRPWSSRFGKRGVRPTRRPHLIHTMAPTGSTSSPRRCSSLKWRRSTITATASPAPRCSWRWCCSRSACFTDRLWRGPESG